MKVKSFLILKTADMKSLELDGSNSYTVKLVKPYLGRSTKTEQSLPGGEKQQEKSKLYWKNRELKTNPEKRRRIRIKTQRVGISPSPRQGEEEENREI